MVEENGSLPEGGVDRDVSRGVRARHPPGGLAARGAAHYMARLLDENPDDENSEGEQSDEQSGEDSEQGEEQSGENQQDGEQGEEASDEQQEGEENRKPSESEMEQNWSEEDAQAMEQWLRRIPDDPGGLLRRKFRNQLQRRGAPADEYEKW